MKGGIDPIVEQLVYTGYTSIYDDMNSLGRSKAGASRRIILRPMAAVTHASVSPNQTHKHLYLLRLPILPQAELKSSQTTIQKAADEKHLDTCTDS